MIKYAWKPLDVGGLRLYKVTMKFHSHPEWNETSIVAAESPTHAREIIKKLYAGSKWGEAPYFDGTALNIYMPAEWWENGVPCEHEPPAAPLKRP